MSEFKTSDLLTELFAKAKMIGKTPNAPVTAERFLVAVIDELNDDANQGVPEVRDLGKILQAFVQDPFSAKQEMLDYIAKSSFTAILDDLKMKNYANRAAAVADELGAPSVTATMLLLCIVKDPNVTIKPVVAKVNSVEGLEDICKAVDKLTPEPLKDDEPTTDTQEESTPSVHAPKLVRKSTIEPEEPEKAEKPEVPEKPDMAALVADVKRIRAELHSSIFGQDNAINVFISGYFQARMLSMMDKNRKRPNATFLFAGPPGVGKTFLAEKAAEALGLPFKRFDMSEYCEKEAAVEFIGSDKVYKDSGEGNFTSFVNQYPKCVVLFDEIEKAHISIIHLFLQILDAGRIRDSKTDREIPLKDAIFIFTTNAGKQLYQGSEDQDLSTISRKVIIDALEKDVNPSTNIPYFPSAICSRFASGNVVMFNHIGVHNLRNIAKKEIQRNAKNLKESMGIDVQMDEHTYTALLFSEGTKADARTTRSRAEAFFNDELYELLRLVSSSKGAQAVSEIEKIEVCVDLENLPDGIADLFTMGENSRIMMLADESTVALCRSKKPTCDFIGVQSSEQAIKTLKNSEIDLIILDVNYGAPQGAADKLNVEDVMTPARELLQLLRDNHDETPVYLLESAAHTINEEEKISYLLRIHKGGVDCGC